MEDEPMTSGSKKKMSDDEKKWRAESDLSALIRVSEIKADKERFRLAMDLAKAQMKQLNAIKE